MNIFLNPNSKLVSFETSFSAYTFFMLTCMHCCHIFIQISRITRRYKKIMERNYFRNVSINLSLYHNQTFPRWVKFIKRSSKAENISLSMLYFEFGWTIYLLAYKLNYMIGQQQCTIRVERLVCSSQDNSGNSLPSLRWCGNQSFISLYPLARLGR